MCRLNKICGKIYTHTCINDQIKIDTFELNYLRIIKTHIYYLENI